jgi:predicted DNA-binding transcriptional regulator AlpA
MIKSALTVDEFCEAHGGISVPFFYKLIKQGKAPRIMKIGARTLISQEAAADWRRAMEEETAAAPKMPTA